MGSHQCPSCASLRRMPHRLGSELCAHVSGRGGRVCRLYPEQIELVAQLTRLWTEPFASESEALAAFGEMYADPVRINGTDVPLAQLVARARMFQRAFSELEIEPIEQIESGDRFVLVFFQRGRHAGPFETPLGSLAPTGRTFEIRVIDVLTISDGRIGAIEVVPDNLSLMTQLDAVRLAK
jgi:ketosteroid isomerase-like protein